MNKNIFISYASEDYQYAKTLHEFLAGNGFAPWMDKKNLLPGQNWDAEIQQALRKADYIIILISQNSVTKRGYVQREFKLALDYCNEKLESDIYIIPVKIDECEVPYGLSKFQWVEYNSVESKNRILESLKHQQREYLKSQSKKYSHQTVSQRSEFLEAVIGENHINNTISETVNDYSAFFEEIKQFSKQIKGNKIQVKEGNLILIDYNMIFKKNRLRLFTKGIIVSLGLSGVILLFNYIDLPRWLDSIIDFSFLVAVIYSAYFLIEFIYCKIFYDKFLSIDLLTLDVKFDNGETFSFNSHPKIYFTKAYNSRRYFVSANNDVKMIHLAIGNPNITVFEKILETILTFHKLNTKVVLKEVNR